MTLRYYILLIFSSVPGCTYRRHLIWKRLQRSQVLMGGCPVYYDLYPSMAFNRDLQSMLEGGVNALAGCCTHVVGFFDTAFYNQECIYFHNNILRSYMCE
jgi:hypothetical protein